MKKYIILGFVIWCLGFAAHAAIISNEELTSVSDAGFIITWTTTDEAAPTEILYGVGAASILITPEASSTNYHYATVNALYPSTTYKYRVKSGSTLGLEKTVTTLARPTGDYLFSFAVLSDTRYAEGQADSVGARGIPYSLCPQIISTEVSEIKAHNAAFIVVNGNIVDSWGTAGEKKGDQAKNEFLSKFSSFTGAADLTNAADRLNPTPGFYDKRSSTYYSSDWITDNLNPLNGSRGGYSGADKNTDSVFNYAFTYKNYRFVFLDSVKDAGTGSQVNLIKARDLITSEAKKSFVFTSFPAYDFRGVNIDGSVAKDYPLDLPTLESGAVSISNDSDFRALLEGLSYEVSGTKYPYTAAVISGHITDNYLRDIHNISYVRQGPAVQWPAGYSIFKVYTNGYVKSFYKTTGRDATGKPYYETARALISTEAGVPGSFLTAFWLGSNSMRNFTYTYPFIAGLIPQVNSSSPANGAGRVPLNKPLVIVFNKKMSTSGINNWLSVSPSVGTLSASFDPTQTILTVRHSDDFTVDKTYAVTVLSAQVRDDDGVAMSTDHLFTFDTNGSTRDLSPPAATITPLPENTTTDILPSFIGVASDECGITNIEYRTDDGIWATAEAVDGSFNSTVEVFTFGYRSSLAKGSHLIELRCTDAAGNITSSDFPSYAFTVAEDKPSISLKINGLKPLPGDPISTTPKVEITVNTVSGPVTGRILVDSIATDLTFTKVDTNYYATHEVTAALADGVHGLTVEATDAVGKKSTYEIIPLYVQTAQELVVQGVPLNNPNPFNPDTQTTTIGYALSKSSNITLSIHELSGNAVVKKSFPAGDNGGRAGYNTVAWDGKSDSGQAVGNGIYVYLIIADGKVAAKGKLTVLKR